MTPNTRTFYEIDKSLRGFTRELARFGHFPLPSEYTLLAAELLCRSFAENSVPRALGAIAIVELRTTDEIKFIVTASGGGDVPDVALEALQTKLQEEIGHLRVSCLTYDTAAVFYAPSHIDTRNFVQDAFSALGAPTSLAGVDAAIAAIKGMPDGLFGFNNTGKMIGGNIKPASSAIHSLLGSAVALRCDLFQAAQRVAALNSIRNFCRWASRHAYPDREKLAINIEALCIPGGNPNHFLYQENPNIVVSTERAIQKCVDAAWACADSSRFCAEPKAFTLIRNRGIAGMLAGQLAMWWDGRPNRFCTPNLTGSPYSEYMLPCTSCAERSGQMVGGLPAYVPDGRALEAPTTVRPHTAVRLRRNSIA